jgi:F-type H+-transporting ATPase subunit b
MKKFLFKPIRVVIEKRQELIDTEIDNARKTNELADEKLADYEGKIANFNSEGEQIISDAKAEAKAEYQKILERADLDADKIRKNAKKQAEEDVQKARSNSKEELTALAMQAAEKIVKGSTSAKTDSDIFDEFLKENN